MRPSTYEEAVKILVDAKFDTSPLNHHIGGMAMRNDWNFWDPESAMHKEFRDRFGLWHADDMSGLISAEVEATVKKQPFDRKAHILSYHRHWRQYSLNPYTGNEIKDEPETEEQKQAFEEKFLQ